MPVPFYTMKIKQRKIVVIQLKRIFTISMLYRFHHGFIRLDLVIKCIKLHLSPPPFFRHDPLYFAILYNKQTIYSSESDTILRYYTKRIVVAPWNTVNGNETNTTAAAVLPFLKTEYIIMKKNYHKTLIACYLGFITQAISANFAPLLFLTFHRTYHISLGKIAFISTVFFFTQLLVDLFCARYVDKIGYRRCVVASEILSACGLIGLAFLPNILPNAYAGILLSAMIYAAGSGLIEVLVSPIVEACPFDNKDSVMSLLHSFYCWGSVGVILLSTAFLAVFGMERWPVLACIWAVLPLYNTFNFLSCPIESLTGSEEGLTIRQLCRLPIFWISLVLMVCAGASEISMAQWASAYAESALGLSKSIGDIAGPCLFAVMMGISRTFYGKYGEKIDLTKFMIASGTLCLICYLAAALAPYPLLNLTGCVVCGFSVGIMWPGTISISSSKIPLGGTALFALLAMAGDMGGSIGPFVIGFVTQNTGDDLKAGMLAGCIFPAVLILSVFLLRQRNAEQK